MKLTKAQDELLRNLENGWEVTLKDGYYTQIKGDEIQKLWPSTFYGLFDQRLVEKLDNGNYTISYDGQQQIRDKNK
jgi:hypothetical protein